MTKINLSLITILLLAILFTAFLIFVVWPNSWFNIYTFFFEKDKSIENWADREVEEEKDSLSDVPLEEPNLPQPNADSPAPSAVVSSTITAIVTAYTSSPEEGTDCISASGWNVCHRTDLGQKLAACPIKYDFGTIVEIEGLRYICVDRMAPRYRNQNRFDIYMTFKEDAFAWGFKNLEIIVWEYNENN